jgi:DNA-binding MarR family transcriptional regulator
MTPLRTIGLLLKDVSRLSQKNFERHAAAVRLGLTLEQCKVLIYLQRNQGINQKYLAYLSDTDQMTLVRILDRMEKDGWIERYDDPQDRRAWRLRLKPAATPVLKQIWTIADRARAESLAGLDATERELLLSLLQRIRRNLEALVPGAIGPDQSWLEEPEPAQTGKRAAAQPRREILKARS